VTKLDKKNEYPKQAKLINEASKRIFGYGVTIYDPIMKIPPSCNVDHMYSAIEKREDAFHCLDLIQIECDKLEGEEE